MMPDSFEILLERLAKEKSHQFADYIEVYGGRRSEARAFYIEGFRRCFEAFGKLDNNKMAQYEHLKMRYEDLLARYAALKELEVGE